MEAANTRAGTTPETAGDRRVRAWAYIFNCWRNKGDCPATVPHDESENKEGSTREQI